MQNAPTILFRNSYECSVCGTMWTDDWSCQCDDRCPRCNAEIEPYHSEEIEPFHSVEIGPTS